MALISQASKVMLKILQARLQKYMNGELPDVEAGFRKRGGTGDQIANIHRIIEKEENSKNIYIYSAEYIMWNARLDETQAGTKISRRNINNLRYADDNTLMVESEEELKSLLMKMKGESEKAGLKLNIQKTKIMASGPITS